MPTCIKLLLWLRSVTCLRFYSNIISLFSHSPWMSSISRQRQTYTLSDNIRHHFIPCNISFLIFCLHSLIVWFDFLKIDKQLERPFSNLQSKMADILKRTVVQFILWIVVTFQSGKLLINILYLMFPFLYNYNDI